MLNPAFVTERLGFEIPQAEMRRALESLELTIAREEPVESGTGVLWTVEIPSWRDDLDRPIDLVEEILRIYGTERIPTAVVSAPGLVEDDDPVVMFNRRAMEYLVGHDFHECVNYTLRPAKELASVVPSGTTSTWALSNPFVEDQSHLRPSLIEGLLETFRLNQSRGVAVARLAEMGRVFLERDGQLVECLAIGFLMAEGSGERSWLQRGPADFYRVKHHVEALAALAGIDLSRQIRPAGDAENRLWQAGHAAVAGDISGGWTAVFGLLNVAAVKAAGIEGRIYAGALVVLPEHVAAEVARRRFKPFGLFPAALRDLAVLVDEAVPAGEVRKALAKAARAVAGTSFAVEQVEVFDVYRGEGLPAGSKSLAFSLVFRAEDRTLTDEEVNRAFLALQTAFVSATGYTLRK